MEESSGPAWAGKQGWRQIISEKEKLLAEYDVARSQARAHSVQVQHGRAAEAAFRRWLTDFLPKRFAVCSGFVVSHFLPESDPLPHFDVIIYDALDAPSLWVETTADVSPGGRARAIPAEHVLAVLEVKAALDAATARAAIAQLRKLEPVMAVDEPGDPYPAFLPRRFACGAVFFELRAKDASKDILAAPAPPPTLRGYFGGTILRAEGRDPLDTAEIKLLQSETPIEPLGDTHWGLSIGPSTTFAPGVNVSAMVTWLPAAFAWFAFGLVAMMRGHYDPGRVPTMHGMAWHR